MENSYLGEFEQLVLLAILRLSENAYGMSIRQEIEQVARRSCSLGAVYTTLDRLEDKGFIDSLIGEATSERGGRQKKYFKVNGNGASALRKSLKATESMKAGLKPAFRVDI